VAMVSGGDGRVFCLEIVGRAALVATNWFRRIDGAWRMVHHQATPLAALTPDDKPPPARRLN